MLPQEQSRVPTMTYDPEQPQLAHRFSMRDEGTCGDGSGFPESNSRSSGVSPTSVGLRPSRWLEGTSLHLCMRPALLAGLFPSVFSPPFTGLPNGQLLPQSATHSNSCVLGG